MTTAVGPGFADFLLDGLTMRARELRARMAATPAPERVEADLAQAHVLDETERIEQGARECPAGPSCSGESFPGHPAHYAAEVTFPTPICPDAEAGKWHAPHRIEGTWREHCPGVAPEDPRDDELHCYHPDHLAGDDWDDWDDDDCVHCECCCTCLGCEYGPRDGVGMTEEQRAPAALIAEATS